MWKRMIEARFPGDEGLPLAFRYSRRLPRAQRRELRKLCRSIRRHGIHLD